MSSPSMSARVPSRPAAVWRRGLGRLAVAALVFVVLLAGCEDDEDAFVPRENPTAADLIDDRDELSALVAALDALSGDDVPDEANLGDLFDDPGQELTLFAPTTTAFEAFLSGAGFDSADDVPVPVLARILRYHVVPQEVRAADLSDGDQLRTLQGELLDVSVADDGGVTIGGANLTEDDLEADNGIVHVIDAVLAPPPTTFAVRIENVGGSFDVLRSGAFDTPVDSMTAGPLGPGASYTFSFTAPSNPDLRLSLATMFIQSNDLFYAFGPDGLPLFDAEGNATTGDVTSEVGLWDAGTEVDEEPGTGANQAPRQDAADTGDDEGGTVTRVTDTDDDGLLEGDGFEYPATSDVIQVSLAFDAAQSQFTVTITNVSEGTTVPIGADEGASIPLSPGAYAVHPSAIDFFTPDEAASASVIEGGLEAIAEDGDPTAATEALAPLTGLTVPLSPGAYAVHSDDVQLFTLGAALSGDIGAGIEAIAEDGTPGALNTALADAGVQANGVFNTPVDSMSPGPLFPGAAYTFETQGEPGARLSLATMYIQSNDLFYAFDPEGLALFDGAGLPVGEGGTGAQTVILYDAGTEGDQEPGVGADQAPRGASDTGPPGEGSVVQVASGDTGGDNDGFSYPAPSEIVRITVTPAFPAPDGDGS